MPPVITTRPIAPSRQWPQGLEAVIGGKWSCKETGRSFSLCSADVARNEVRLVSSADGDHWRGTIQEAMQVFVPGRAALRTAALAA